MKPWSQFLTGIGMAILLLGLVFGSFFITFVESGRIFNGSMAASPSSELFLPETNTAISPLSPPLTETAAPLKTIVPAASLTASFSPLLASSTAFTASASVMPAIPMTSPTSYNSPTPSIQFERTPAPSATYTLIPLTVISKPDEIIPLSPTAFP